MNMSREYSYLHKSFLSLTWQVFYNIFRVMFIVCSVDMCEMGFVSGELHFRTDDLQEFI